MLLIGSEEYGLIWIIILCTFQIEKDAFEEAEKVRRAREEEVTYFVYLLLEICNFFL
jgi:hypothetical protein